MSNERPPIFTFTVTIYLRITATVTLPFGVCDLLGLLLYSPRVRRLILKENRRFSPICSDYPGLDFEGVLLKSEHCDEHRIGEGGAQPGGHCGPVPTAAQ